MCLSKEDQQFYQKRMIEDYTVIYMEVKQFRECCLIDHETYTCIMTQLSSAVQIEHIEERAIPLSAGSYLFLWKQRHWHTILNRINTIDDIMKAAPLAFGICYPQESDTLEHALYKAQIAAWRTPDYAKYTTSYELYDTLLEESLSNDILLQKHLKTAMQEGKLRVFIQPKVDLGYHQIVGCEALIRWQHEGAWIPLKILLATIQKNSFIRQVDQYVLHQAFHLQSLCLKHQYPLKPISVNISDASLQRRDHYLSCLNRLEGKYSIPPKAIDFEISEDIISCNSDDLADFMTQLCQKGYTVSMDDFGSGSASLTALSTLPFTTIKFDRSFFLDSHNKKGNQLLLAMMHMIKELGFTIVAEGIEDTSYLSLLKECGCDQIQGYYFYQPMPISEYLHLLKDLCL